MLRKIEAKIKSFTEFERVGGHLFVIAVNSSKQAGYDFTAKTDLTAYTKRD